MFTVFSDVCAFMHDNFHLEWFQIKWHSYAREEDLKVATYQHTKTCSANFYIRILYSWGKKKQQKLTKLGKNSGLRMCIILTIWNMSTSSSSSIISNTRLSAAKTLLLVQPSLIKEKYCQT